MAITAWALKGPRNEMTIHTLATSREGVVRIKKEDFYSASYTCVEVVIIEKEEYDKLLSKQK